MPRGPRIIPWNDSTIIHFIARGNNHQKLFRRYADYMALYRRLCVTCQNHGIAVYHYGFLTTHIHLLLHIANTRSLPIAVKSFTLGYFHYYRRAYGYSGHLWQGRYRSILVSSEAHFLQSSRYIELQAVYAGLCKDPADYPWTSYHYYARGHADALITEGPYYSQMGAGPDERQVTYTRFVADGCDISYQRELKRYAGRDIP